MRFILTVQALMLFAAEKFAAVEVTFAARQMHSAMGAAHHVFGHAGRWRLLARQGGAVFFQDPPGPRENQNDEQQFTQTWRP